MATATVQVESYRKTTDAPLRPSGEQTVTLTESYQRAGLSRLASSLGGHADAKSRQSSADVLYGRMSSSELATWRAFLPRSYSPMRYDYDVPPEEVALAIADAGELKIFDHIEIWTGEGSGIVERTRAFYRRAAQKVHSMLEIAADPLAVGVIEHGGVAYYYPIVRWGESLQSFSRIKATVRWRSLVVFAMTKLPMILLGLVVFGLLAWGFAATWWAIGAWAIPIWGSSAFMLLVIVASFYS